MATIHISESDASSDFAGVLHHLREGAEVVIESHSYPTMAIRAASPSRRTVSECIVLARKHEEEKGEAPVLDFEFAADVEEVLRTRKPSDLPGWD